MEKYYDFRCSGKLFLGAHATEISKNEKEINRSLRTPAATSSVMKYSSEACVFKSNTQH